MSDKIKFDWDLYKTGNYKVVSRDGVKIRKVFKVPRKEIHNTPYPLTAFSHGGWSIYTEDGCYYSDGEYSTSDIFLVKKKKVKNEEI